MNILASDDRADQQITSSPPALLSHSPTSPSDIQTYLDKYPFASEPSYFTRPNRHHGPPSTWRFWTADDRAVADSLDIIRARNLSIHLYNAFDLKRRNQLVPRAGPSERRSNPDHAQNTAEQQFIPPEIWTAWPLRGHQVPRRSGPHDFQGSTAGPSAALEDALLAQSLRHAKVTWTARESEPDPTPLVAIERKNEREITKQESEAQISHPHWENSDATSELGGIDDPGSAEELGNDLPEGVEFFSSQAFAAQDDPSSPSENGVSMADPEDDHPVFCADDEVARVMLMPSTRHILSKLDDLLAGLHKARLAYAVRRNNSRSRSHSEISGAETTGDERYIRSGSRAASKKRGRKRKRSPSSSLTVDHGPQSRSQSRSRPAVRQFGMESSAYGLRDWSDVLGMAALTGWSIETVARAGERCAKLFNQNMAFRTFHQTTGAQDGTQESPWFEEEMAYHSATSECDDHPTPQDGQTNHNPSPNPDSQQEAEYIRTSPRCTRCKIQQIRCRPPDISSDIDTTHRVACRSCSANANLNTPCSGITITIAVQPRLNPTSKMCPYLDCQRNNPSKPFAKNYHLQRHLKDVHGHLYSPPVSPAPIQDPAPITDDISKLNLAIRGPVRPLTTIAAAAGSAFPALLVCPLVSCPRHTHAFKRSTRLYDHVKQAHPEIDVASFKRLVAKGSGSMRGKYDRSQSRSRVRTQDAGEEGVERGGEYGDEGDGEEREEEEEEEQEQEDQHDGEGKRDVDIHLRGAEANFDDVESQDEEWDGRVGKKHLQD